ncbi:MAG: hypothetical protein ACXVBW_12260, partial [Bdellovibrionota bacterium]
MLLGKTAFLFVSLFIISGSNAFAYVVGYDTSVPASSPMPAVDVPFVDPNYGTTVTRVTNASQVTDGQLPTWVRHEYSRRPAFNVDSSRAIMESSNGWLRLYSVDLVGNKMSFIKTLKVGGSIEPNWDPIDPNVFYHFGNNGSGFVIYKYDITTDQDVAYRDLSSPVLALYPQAASMWTKEEGRPSRDGKIWCMMIEKYDTASGSVSFYGFISYNIATNQLLGHYNTSDRPDHISASPNGNYCVPSSDTAGIGTRAYSLDFSKYTQLHTSSEHSDLAL